MNKLLYIVTSPRGDDSKSNALALAYIEAQLKNNSNLEIDILNLWDQPLPEFSGKSAAAKMTFFGVGEMDSTTLSAWDKVVEITNRFNAADHYVFSVPMWNGGIPYKLKHYIDIITQPGLLFGFDPEKGYSGMLGGKKATIFYTSGVYSQNAHQKYGADYHSTYLKWWLNMIGISNIESIRFQPSLLTEDPKKRFEEALIKAKNLVQD